MQHEVVNGLIQSLLQEREKFVELMEKYFAEDRKPFKKHFLKQIKISHAMISSLDVSVIKYSITYNVPVPHIPQPEIVTKYRLIYMSLSQCRN